MDQRFEEVAKRLDFSEQIAGRSASHQALRIAARMVRSSQQARICPCFLAPKKREPSKVHQSTGRHQKAVPSSSPSSIDWIEKCLYPLNGN
jgi:hypothetical protein